MENVNLSLEPPDFCDSLDLFGELCVDNTSWIIFAEEVKLVVSSLYTKMWEYSGF